MDNLKEYEKVAKFYERADKIYNRLVKAMFEGEVGGLDTSTVLYVTEMFTAQMLLVVYGEQALPYATVLCFFAIFAHVIHNKYNESRKLLK